jgi:hypothetical protein
VYMRTSFRWGGRRLGGAVEGSIGHGGITRRRLGGLLWLLLLLAGMLLLGHLQLLLLLLLLQDRLLLELLLLLRTDTPNNLIRYHAGHLDRLARSLGHRQYFPAVRPIFWGGLDHPREEVLQGRAEVRRRGSVLGFRDGVAEGEEVRRGRVEGRFQGGHLVEETATVEEQQTTTRTISIRHTSWSLSGITLSSSPRLTVTKYPIESHTRCSRSPPD